MEQKGGKKKRFLILKTENAFSSRFPFLINFHCNLQFTQNNNLKAILTL